MTPRSVRKLGKAPRNSASGRTAALKPRSEEHTSELQSRSDLECRLLLVKKKRRALRGQLPLSGAACSAPTSHQARSLARGGGEMATDSAVAVARPLPRTASGFSRTPLQT